VNWEARHDKNDKWYHWRIYKKGHDLPIINIVPGEKAEEYARMVEVLPDLLTACEPLIAWGEQSPSGVVDGWAMLDNAINEIRAAIAKTKGR